MLYLEPLFPFGLLWETALLIAALSLIPATAAAGTADPAYREAARDARRALVERHGPGEAERIERGAGQVLGLWRPGDGDPAALQAFLEAEFVPRGAALDALFDRFEFAMERIGGYMTSLTRDLRRGADLEIGPRIPLDDRLAAFDAGAHLSDDYFRSKLAFVALLNFPRTTLAERLERGGSWTRREWAEARLADRFAARVPGEVNQKLSEAYARADGYIAGYNLYLHHLLTPDGGRPFPAGLRLISHWGLRDELKARYGDPAGLEKQRLIARAMERIVRQEIPAAVVNNPLLDWTPESNAVAVSPERDAEPPPGAAAEARGDREPDERYRQWLSIFHAERLEDPHRPDHPTHVARRFEVDREIPEAEVERLFDEVLSSPLGARAGRLAAARLGRPLEPFDIWFAGFSDAGRRDEAALDALTRARYPDAAAFAADLPRLFAELGFGEERARFLAERIAVEPSRGAGHAYGASRPDDRAHLRTRVAADGMDYKGYNIAVHELGHNAEQVFSVSAMDHTLLQGVPNTAFTEALAFVFQSRNLRLLGVDGEEPRGQEPAALDLFWGTREIAAVALVDMRAWRWLYANPEAGPAEFRQAVCAIAGEVWNRYFAEIFGTRDVVLLAIYSHMVDSGMYTPDYPLGHLIEFQIEEHFRGLGAGAPIGPEFERMARIGSVTPDRWMREAVGAPLSAAPLLQAAERAVAALGG